MTHGPLPALDGVQVVFVCFSNRSGSNYLCEALGSTGVLNVGEELLNWPVVLEAARVGGHDTLHATLNAMIAPAVRDGRFVIKVAPMHLLLLIRAGIMDQVMARATFIHIERADRLAQAISFTLAAQTRAWKSHQATRLEPKFDRAQITSMLGGLTELIHQFDRFFAVNGIVPVGVSYERLVADPAAEVARVGAAIGIPDLGFDPGAIRLARQAGPINDAWRERYLTDDD